MYTKAYSTFLLALFACLLASVDALPRVLHARVTATPTTPLPSASFSMQASSHMPSSMATQSPWAQPTIHAIPNSPMADLENDSTTETTSTTSSTTSSTTPSPTASDEDLADSLSLVTSMTNWLSSFEDLLGLA